MKTSTSEKKTKSAKKDSTATPAVSTPTLGKIVLVHTKSSSYWFALLEPKIVSIEEMRFLEGIQVTGKETHRMEKKRTLIPFDHVASIVEFENEENLWKQSAGKQVQVNDENIEDESSFPAEQPHQRNNHRKRHRHHRRENHGPRSNYDGHLQAKYDQGQYRKFNRQD